MVSHLELRWARSSVHMALLVFGVALLHTVSGKVGAWLPGVAGGRASRENVGAKDRGAGGDAFGGHWLTWP